MKGVGANNFGFIVGRLRLTTKQGLGARPGCKDLLAATIALIFPAFKDLLATTIAHV